MVSSAASTLRSRNTSTYIYVGTMAAFLGMAMLPETLDPEGTRTRAAERCIQGLKPGPSATFPCSDRVFDYALALFLSRNPGFEVMNAIPIAEGRNFGSTGTVKITVFFRERS